jgi:hypothetical protein
MRDALASSGAVEALGIVWHSLRRSGATGWLRGQISRYVYDNGMRRSFTADAAPLHRRYVMAKPAGT